MVFLSSLPEMYAGKQFEIDCVDIEIHSFEGNQSPIFKGPGVIRGDRAGRLTYKVYNQVQFNKENFDYLKRIREEDDPKRTNIRIFAKSYEGTEWNGGWSIPQVNLYNAPYLLIQGEFYQLSTHVCISEGDKNQDTTELIFSDQLDIPFAGTVEEKIFHGEKLISTSYWGDHHNVTFEDASILFQLSPDKSRLHVKAPYGEQFASQYIENWITEALSFVTARVIHPRMVIRHFKKDAHVFIMSTPRDIESRMPPPFFSEPSTRDSFWQAFCAYLHKCKSVQKSEPLDLTNGFWELCLASTGTLQGFLISLSIYIEFCVNEIFSSLKSVEVEKNNMENKKNVEDLIQHVSTWDGDEAIRERAKGLLSMLNTPSLSERMDILIKHGVITDMQKSIWKKVRPYLAHGNVIDFGKEEEFWHFRNHIISMVYRLIFRIIGYKGFVLDYNGREFVHIAYDWKDESLR